MADNSLEWTLTSAAAASTSNTSEEKEVDEDCDRCKESWHTCQFCKQSVCSLHSFAPDMEDELKRAHKPGRGCQVEKEQNRVHLSPYQKSLLRGILCPMARNIVMGVIKAGLDLVCDKMTIANGSCLFNAVFQQAKRPEILQHLCNVQKNGVFAPDNPETLRDFLSNFMKESKDAAVLRMREQYYAGCVEGQTTWEEFWENMAKPGVWANEYVLKALALFLETDMNIVMDSGHVMDVPGHRGDPTKSMGNPRMWIGLQRDLRHLGVPQPGHYQSLLPPQKPNPIMDLEDEVDLSCHGEDKDDQNISLGCIEDMDVEDELFELNNNSRKNVALGTHRQHSEELLRAKGIQPGFDEDGRLHVPVARSGRGHLVLSCAQTRPTNQQTHTNDLFSIMELDPSLKKKVM